MSYLLTEIALEMLGYKFYDTNGIFHLTNFQSNTTQSESHPDEPSLRDFIEESESEATVETPSQNGHKVESEANTSSITPSPEIPASPLPSSSLNPRRTPARALSKIMEYESEKICCQITKRLSQTMEKQGADDNILECIKEENKKILEDAEEMQKFREFLEDRLRRIDKRPYEKYVRTFGSE